MAADCWGCFPALTKTSRPSAGLQQLAHVSNALEPACLLLAEVGGREQSKLQEMGGIIHHLYTVAQQQ